MLSPNGRILAVGFGVYIRISYQAMQNNPELLTVYQYDKKIRCGDKHDGGYVIGEIDVEYDCYISAGVSNEESFSRDFINKYNMNKSNCFAFDGTIDTYPYVYTDKITFIKKNINNYNDEKNTDLGFLIDNYSNIFLKMDIEGWEYPWLLCMGEERLARISQIVMEFHGITDDGWGYVNEKKVKCLEKLARTHFIIHAHGNNHGPVVDRIPDVIELTFVNKNLFSSIPELNSQSLPIPNLDFPCSIDNKDINMNFCPFVKTK